MQRKESHSSISTYLDCQKKYELIYVKGLKQSNPHFIFGSMAHKVLETREIPDEILYQDLKETFNISSWNIYFNQIFKELDVFLEDYDIIGREVCVENDTLIGVIDLVLRHKETNRLLLCDYKFSNGVKSYDDLLLDEQLQIYSILYSSQFNEHIDNIDICYINIPKTQLSSPRVLSNGKLSKDKSQNTSFELYVNKINELGLCIDDYQDVLSMLKDKHFINIYKNTLNLDMIKRVCVNIDNTIKDMQKGYYLEKCTYMCKQCPFVQYCKYNKEITK